MFPSNTWYFLGIQISYLVGRLAASLIKPDKKFQDDDFEKGIESIISNTLNSGGISLVILRKSMVTII
jgi:hypothetical protein